MLLKEVLSLKTLSELDSALQLYGINLDHKAKKKELIEIFHKSLLEDDFILLNLLRLTNKDEKIIRNSLYHDIKITEHNAPNILNLEQFLYGICDGENFIIATDLANKIIDICKDKIVLEKIVNLRYLNQILAYASNFHGIFSLEDIYKLVILDSRYKEYSLSKLKQDIIELNKVLIYFKEKDNFFISSIAEGYGYERLLEAQKGIKTYIPTLKEIEEFFNKRYIKTKDLNIIFNNFKNIPYLERERLLRLIFTAHLTDDITCKTLLTTKIDDIDLISNLKLPKLSLRGGVGVSEI